MTAGAPRPRPRPSRRRTARGTALLWLLAVAAGAVVFALGVALGEALHDNPVPGVTTTSVTTVGP